MNKPRLPECASAEARQLMMSALTVRTHHRNLALVTIQLLKTRRQFARLKQLEKRTSLALQEALKQQADCICVVEAKHGFTISTDALSMLSSTTTIDDLLKGLDARS